MTAPVGDDLTWLDDLERAHAAATPGPWERDGEYPAEIYNGRSGEAERLVAECHNNQDACHSVADAALIVAAVNAVPTLIADARELRALREAVEGLAGLVEQGRAWTGDSLARRLRATLAAHLAPATPPAQEDTDA